MKKESPLWNGIWRTALALFIATVIFMMASCSTTHLLPVLHDGCQQNWGYSGYGNSKK